MAWLDALVDAGIAPPDARADLPAWSRPADDEWLAADAEAGGNPAIGPGRACCASARGRRPDAARWLHRGLTSQDVARHRPDADGPGRRRASSAPSCRGQAERLAGLADDAPRHPDGGPHAHPARRAHDVRPQGRAVADRRARRVRRPRGAAFPVQIGGAAGTRAAAGRARRPTPPSWSSTVAAAPRPRARRAVAHPRGRRHPARRRAGQLHRRLGPDRRRRAAAEPARDRRAQRGAPAAARRRCPTSTTRSCRC